MWEKLKKFVMNMITEHDNKTVCPVKTSGVLGVLALFVLTGYHEYKKIHVTEQDFSISLSIALAATGAGVGVKRSSEHDGDDDGPKETGGAQ